MHIVEIMIEHNLLDSVDNDQFLIVAAISIQQIK